MVTYTKNYYIELKADIDPKVDRSENFGKLKMASAKYSQMNGMDVILKLVEEALDIFGNEEKYKVYRKDYITLALETFIRGATENNKIPSNKYDELLEIAWKKFGISESEVKIFLQSLDIEIYKAKKANVDQKSREKKIAEDQKNREKKKRKVIIALIVSIALILFVAIFYITKPPKQSANSERPDNAKTTINFTDALKYIDIIPPEYSKIEEAIESFKENIDMPGAKEGLIKAAEIYIKWGDDAPTIGESRTMYQKALECSSAAKSSRTDEIKAKLEEMTLKE